MDYEVEKYKNLKRNVNNLAREINLAISSLEECSKLYSNYKIDEVSKEQKGIKDIVENLENINSKLKYTVINSINNEINNLVQEIESQDI